MEWFKKYDVGRVLRFCQSLEGDATISLTFKGGTQILLLKVLKKSLQPNGWILYGP